MNMTMTIVATRLTAAAINMARVNFWSLESSENDGGVAAFAEAWGRD